MVGVIAQPAARQIHRHVAVIVEFDVIEIRQIGVRQKLIDDHIAHGFEHAVHRPGEPPIRSLCPHASAAFTIGGAG